MPDIRWLKDVDAALQEAKAARRPVLVDFSAVPTCGGCARLEAEVFPNARVIQALSTRFVPVKVRIKEQKRTFQRFNAQWTPTQIVLDADGVERHRMEGFLPVDDFLAQLELGLGKLHAEKRLRSVCESFPGAGAAPEACYWAGVSAYKGSNDARHLGSTARELKERYSDSEWARKASVWDQ